MLKDLFLYSPPLKSQISHKLPPQKGIYSIQNRCNHIGLLKYDTLLIGEQYQLTQYHILHYSNFYQHIYENLKSHVLRDYQLKCYRAYKTNETSPVVEDMTVISLASLDISVVFENDGAHRCELESPQQVTPAMLLAEERIR